jgi:hypothetical protein
VRRLDAAFGCDQSQPWLRCGPLARGFELPKKKSGVEPPHSKEQLLFK